MSREDERIEMLSDTVTNLSIAQEIEFSENVAVALDHVKAVLTTARIQQTLKDMESLSGEEVIAIRQGDLMYAAMLYQQRSGLDAAIAKNKVLRLIEESGLVART